MDNKDIKKSYYSKRDVVSKYNKNRFSSTGGMYVNNKEFRTINQLCPSLGKDSVIIDFPVGTGRITKGLHSQYKDSTFIGADNSENMLKYSQAILREFDNIVFVKADFFDHDISDGDLLISSRFIFHVSDLSLFFKSASLLLKRGGTVIFDALSWSPRNLIPLLNKYYGGKLYCHKYSVICDKASQYGFEIVSTRSIFLFPSYVYNFFPRFLVSIIDKLESYLPAFVKTKKYYLMRKK